MMLNEALQFLLDVLVQPFAAILLLRFHLQWLHAPLRNPVGEFVMVFTDFIVLPARRYIPSIRKLDTSTLLLALLVETLYLTGFIGLQGYPFHGFPLPGLAFWAAVKLLKISLYLLMGAVFVQAILSWVNPYTPYAPVLSGITERFLRPLRRIIPVVGNLDLSTLVLFIVCNLILIVPVAALEHLAMRLL